MFSITETNTPDLETYHEYVESYQDDAKDQMEFTANSKADYAKSFTNKKYNECIYQLCDNFAPLNILDIGCGPGGFISQVVEDGHNGVGIDVDREYMRRGIYWWKELPYNLFIRDFGQPLTIAYDRQPVKFDFIQSWDVFEHIKEGDIPHACENIVRHSNNTPVVLKIATWSSPCHRTVHPREWWLSRFDQVGMYEDDRVRKAFDGTHMRPPNNAHMFYMRTQ